MSKMENFVVLFLFSKKERMLRKDSINITIQTTTVLREGETTDKEENENDWK